MHSQEESLAIDGCWWRGSRVSLKDPWKVDHTLAVGHVTKKIRIVQIEHVRFLIVCF